MKRIIVNAIPLRGQMNGIGRYVKCLFDEMIRFKDLDIDFFYGTYSVSYTHLTLPTIYSV